MTDTNALQLNEEQRADLAACMRHINGNVREMLTPIYPGAPDRLTEVINATVIAVMMGLVLKVGEPEHPDHAVRLDKWLGSLDAKAAEAFSLLLARKGQVG